MASLLDLGEKIRAFSQSVISPVQQKLQQAELARIAYQRERAAGQPRPVPQILQPAARAVNYLQTTKNPLVSAPMQLGAGLIQGANLGLTPSPYRPPTTTPERFAFGGGNILGSLNPKSATGLVTKGFSAATNPVLSKIIKPFGGQIASRIAAGAANVAQGEGFERTVPGRTPTNTGRALDFVVGAVGGKGQFGGKVEQVLDQLSKPLIGKQLKFKPRAVIDVEDIEVYDMQIRPAFERAKDLSFPDASFIRRVLKQVTNASDAELDKMSAGELLNEFARQANFTEEAMKPKSVLRPLDFGMGFAATKEGQIPQPGKQLGNKSPSPMVSNGFVESPKQQSVLQGGQTGRKLLKQNQVQSSESIITDAKKGIGALEEKPQKLSFKQDVKKTFDNLYTQWVDRYHPITQASKQAKKVGQIETKNDPEYLVRRLTGAGGIADSTFRRELNPILKQMETFKIDKGEMDVYLKARRDLGLAKRGIKGSDTKKAQQVVNAIEQKYGTNVDRIAQQLYSYQNKYFDELVDSGFISKESAETIRKQNPDYVPFERIMDTELDDYLGLPTRKTMQAQQVVKKIKGSERQIYSPIESIIANTYKHRAAIEKNRVAKSIVGLQQVAPELGFQKVSKAGEDTISVWNNGKKEFWQVGRDIADTAKGVNEESMNTVLKLIQAPASLLRQGATGRNPEFMIPNIIRDQLDAGITSKYGYIPFIDYFSGLKSMVTNDEVFKQFEMSGAKIDLGELSGRKSIQKLFSEAQGKRKLSDWLGAGLDVLGKYSEQPTRVGLFKKAYKATGDPLKAMLESRDATVDFARMGTKMRVANSIIPFLNVGIQGFDKLIRSVKSNPGKVLFNMTLYGATPAIATTLYNLQNNPEEYAEIPQYEKDSNFILVKGRNENGTVDYLKFPKGNILPLVSNPIESALSYAFNTNQQTFSEFATNFVSTALPVIGEGSSLKEIGIKTIGSNLPQAIKPITENLINKSFYKYDPKKEETKEIVPYYLKDKPAYQQDYEFTPVMYKKIGAALNVSPLQVQNLMEGYLAGFSKIPSQAIEMITKVSRGEEISPNEKTLLRRFVGQTYPTSGSKKSVETPESPSLMERLTGKASAAEETNTPEKINQKIEDARDKVNETGKPQTVGDKYIYFDSDSGTVKSFSLSTKKYQTQDAQFTLNAQRQKAEGDFEGYIGTLENHIKLLEGYKKTLDKKADSEKIIKAQNRIEDFQAKLAKYKGYGGFKKGRKPKAVTFKRLSSPKISFSSPKRRAAPTLNLKKPPKIKLAKKKKKVSLKLS